MVDTAYFVGRIVGYAYGVGGLGAAVVVVFALLKLQRMFRRLL